MYSRQYMLASIFYNIAYPKLDVSSNDIQHLILDFFHWSYILHLILAEMNVDDIYITTILSLLQMIYFC